MGEGLKDLLDLSRADITTKRPARKKRGLGQISELGARIRAIEAEDARVPPLPKGLGTAIGGALGIPPSRKLGDVMKALEAKCLAGELEGQKDFAYYVAYVEAHRDDFDV
jgi:poly(A) polymerase